MHSLVCAQQCVEAARAAGADAADALYYNSASLSVSHRMGKPEDLEQAESAGVGLRVFVGKRFAAVSSSDTSTDALKEMASRAVAMARLAPEDKFSGLAPEDKLTNAAAELELFDPVQPGAEVLQRQCAEAEAAALATPGITNSEGAHGGYGSTEFTLATSHGFAGSYRSSHHSLSVSVLAGSGTAMERDYDFTSARFASDMHSPEIIGRKAAQRALRRLNPRKAATGNVPVIFDPRVGRRLLGAFTGAINGAAVARGTSFLKEAMHKQVFAEGVTIIDDPLRPRGLGSHPFDGEGVRVSRCALVRDGRLESWLLDVRSAAQLGLSSLGHAVRGMSSAPSPSPSNCHMEAGHLTPAELMEDIKQGFYVTELIGMGVNLVTGDYSQGASGFWIEQGKIAYPVSEVTIAGRLQEMFLALTPANDLVFEYATNTPTLRVEGMMVAGR